MAARGTLTQTQASTSLAHKNFERANQLAPSGVVSQQELQQAQAALTQGGAGPLTTPPPEAAEEEAGPPGIPPAALMGV